MGSADYLNSLNQLALLGRKDINAFCERVMRDEETGRRIAQAPIHEAWHDLAERHNRLVIWSAIEHGKTHQMSIARPLWLIGKDPKLRIVVVSNTFGQAEKIIGAISRYITQSDDYKAVFPNVIPDEPWTNHAITVRRPFISKDPSIQAIGVHGNILGSRIDVLIMDDLLDPENTHTDKQREDLWRWYNATLHGRLTAKSRVLVVGTAFHPDDILHKWANQGWTAKRYPVLDDRTSKPRWPERWPMERIEAKRAGPDALTPLEFARQLLCVPMDDAAARFKREWINTGLQRGKGKQCAYAIHGLPQGYKTYTGVDLAVQSKEVNDKTVLFTILLHPDETREILEIESGRWSGPDIVNKVIDVHNRFYSIVRVENNAAQDFILQFTRNVSAVPVLPLTTGRNKIHPEFGVESLAAELQNGKWIIPSPDGIRGATREIDEWIAEMVYYDPLGHTGDRLMAAWFAREAARQGNVRGHAGYLGLSAR